MRLTLAPLTTKNKGMNNPYARPLSLSSRLSLPSGSMARITKPAAKAPSTMSRSKMADTATRITMVITVTRIMV